METDQTQVRQNLGVADRAEDTHGPINGETIAPGATGRTEGGMPAGTPPAAAPAGSLAREVTPVEDTEPDTSNGQGS